MKKVILVTAVGTWSAEAVIGSLIDQGFVVIGTDLFPPEYDPTTAPLCADFMQVVKAGSEPELYCAELLEFASRNSCYDILPLMDPEVDVLSENRDLFENRGIHIWLCDKNTISNSRRKDVWSKRLNFCNEFSVIPSYTSFEDLKLEYEGDFVAKKVKGRSSEGIFFGNTGKDSNLRVWDEDEYLFQPYIAGSVITVDFVRHPLSRHVVSLPRKELVRTKTGGGTVVEILNPDLTKNAVEELTSALNITGVMNCEFILSKEGVLYLMDINPRFSAGVSFSLRAGYDFVRAAVDCRFSRDIIPEETVRSGKIYVKRYVDFESQTL